MRVDVSGDATQVEEDAAARRRVMGFVVAAIKRAWPHLEAAGVTGRMLYSCLWHSAVNVLLITIEPELVVKLLENRAKPLDPLGANAGAELVEVPESGREARRRLIMAGSQILTSSFMASMEEAEAAGVGDIFPESVLDQAMERLAEEWGPFHLRDALWDQAEALSSGQGVIVDVREPVLSASNRHAAAGPFVRGFRSRAVVLRLDAEVSSGKPRWAYAMHVNAADGTGFAETREASCPVPGANALRVFLAGAAEALEAIRGDGGGAHVMAEAPNAALLAGIASSSSRNASDAAAWKRLDDVMEGVEVDWRRHVPAPGHPDELGQRCARLLGRELVRAG